MHLCFDRTFIENSYFCFPIIFLFLFSFFYWKTFEKMYKSSHQRCSVKKGVLRNFSKSTGKHLCQSLFFSKVAGALATLLKKRLWHRCFPVNFAKFLRTPFSQNTAGRLLLNVARPCYACCICLGFDSLNRTQFLRVEFLLA